MDGSRADLGSPQVKGQHRAARAPGLLTQLAPALRTSPRIEHSAAILANGFQPTARVRPAASGDGNEEAPAVAGEGLLDHENEACA
jgi:hypothetical protein